MNKIECINNICNIDEDRQKELYQAYIKKIELDREKNRAYQKKFYNKHKSESTYIKKCDKRKKELPTFDEVKNKLIDEVQKPKGKMQCKSKKEIQNELIELKNKYDELLKGKVI